MVDTSQGSFCTHTTEKTTKSGTKNENMIHGIIIRICKCSPWKYHFLIDLHLLLQPISFGFHDRFIHSNTHDCKSITV